VLRIDVPAFTAVVAAMVLYVGAYMTEIVREPSNRCTTYSGRRGTRWRWRPLQVLRFVVLPQAVRVAIPPTVGLLVGSIKDSSLASAVGYVELTRAGMTIRNVTFTSFSVFAAVAIIYFIVCSVVSRLGTYLEGRLKYPH